MILDPQLVTLATADGTDAILRWVDDYTTATPLWEVTHDAAANQFAIRDGAGTDVFTIADADNTVRVDGAEVLTAGAAIDAETLDGLDSSQFLRSDQTDTLAGDLSVTGSLSAGGNAVRTTADDEAVRPSVSDDNTQVAAGPTDIDFGGNMVVTDQGDGTVVVDVADPDEINNTHTAVSDDATQVLSDVDDINFATGASVTDDGDGTVTVAVDVTPADISDDGALAVAAATDLNFGSNLAVTDDGDGTATLAATHVDIEDDAASVQANASHINFGAALDVSVDGSGVTVDAITGGTDADTLDGLDASQFVRADVADDLEATLTITTGGIAVPEATTALAAETNATAGGAAGIVTPVEVADTGAGDTVAWRRNANTDAAFAVYNATTDTTVFAVQDTGTVLFGEAQADGFRLENRTSDRNGSMPGTMWLRTDL